MHVLYLLDYVRLYDICTRLSHPYTVFLYFCVAHQYMNIPLLHAFLFILDGHAVFVQYQWIRRC